MKIINKRNVKAMVPLIVKGNKKTEFAVKHPPILKARSKRVKE